MMRAGVMGGGDATVDSRRFCAQLEAFRAKKDAESTGNSGRLLHLRVLRLGFLQDGDVGVGVFPEGVGLLPRGKPIRRSRSAKRESERRW
jgi:hypothetical protein